VRRGDRNRRPPCSSLGVFEAICLIDRGVRVARIREPESVDRFTALVLCQAELVGPHDLRPEPELAYEDLSSLPMTCERASHPTPGFALTEAPPGVETEPNHRDVKF